ncbi:MAG: DUF5683 domain-containing protein [Bacteroidales bacterium]|nr:DUF5683 domain-containing protein [Bacteroidales bacterium]
MTLKKRILVLLAATAFAGAFCSDASAQFKEQAFSQQYNDDKGQSDSTAVVFSFKEYFGGLGHKNELKIGNSFAGSFIFIGGQQIYNKDYWKLPIIYGAIGTTLGAGLVCNAKGNTDAARYWFIGSGIAYWATLMDGVVCYRPSVYPHAGKATIYSILLPGLGQIYNREYWKLPLYIGGMVCAAHFTSLNQTNFLRFKNIYAEASQEGYSGPVTKEQAKYYRDLYRRYRDYSVLALAAVYVLQIVDANVFSYMHDFDIDDDLSLKVSPAILPPDNHLASISNLNDTAFGLRLGLTF